MYHSTSDILCEDLIVIEFNLPLRVYIPGEVPLCQSGAIPANIHLGSRLLFNRGSPSSRVRFGGTNSNDGLTSVLLLCSLRAQALQQLLRE